MVSPRLDDSWIGVLRRIRGRSGSPRSNWTGPLGLIVILIGVPVVGGCAGSGGAPPTAIEGTARAPFPQTRLVSDGERESFLGSRACVTCHPKQAGQLASRHARTLQEVDPKFHGPLFAAGKSKQDPLDELTFHTAFEDGACVLKATDESGAAKDQATAQYVFGSGAIGYTYVSYSKGKPIQLRLTHFAGPGKWDFTPGQSMGGGSNSALGEILQPNGERMCFSCHSTALVKRGEELDLKKSILGVGCETCHGPGKAHVAAVNARSPDLKMARLSTIRNQLSMELCGQCHRAPANISMQGPGMAAQLPRLQGIALSRSGCYLTGGVTCFTCHEPHEDATAVSRAAHNGKCSSCHSGSDSRQIVCRTQPQGDCVSCHMPAQDVGMPTGPRFHNHWIKVWTTDSANRPLSLPE